MDFGNRAFFLFLFPPSRASTTPPPSPGPPSVHEWALILNLKGSKITSRAGPRLLSSSPPTNLQVFHSGTKGTRAHTYILHFRRVLLRSLAARLPRRRSRALMSPFPIHVHLLSALLLHPPPLLLPLLLLLGLSADGTVSFLLRCYLVKETAALWLSAKGLISLPSPSPSPTPPAAFPSDHENPGANRISISRLARQVFIIIHSASSLQAVTPLGAKPRSPRTHKTKRTPSNVNGFSLSPSIQFIPNVHIPYYMTRSLHTYIQTTSGCMRRYLTKHIRRKKLSYKKKQAHVVIVVAYTNVAAVVQRENQQHEEEEEENEYQNGSLSFLLRI